MKRFDPEVQIVKQVKSPFAVESLDGEVLLPDGIEFSFDELDDFVTVKRRKSFTMHSLLGYGTIKKDLEHFMTIPRPYRVIFSDTAEREAILGVMGCVQVGTPILSTLDYFKKEDFHTYRHMLMIYALSILLARVLVPGGNEQMLEAAAGPTHDLGKILVPLEILRKKEPLTKSERLILEFHTVAGYLLLSYYIGDQRDVAAKVARDHHERLNGSGYPQGICQKERLVEIVAACDVYDALISPRPYRSVSYDNRTALEELTVMAEQGEISWEVLQALIAFNRAGRPAHFDVKVSSEKRGSSPADNSYGKIIEDLVIGE
jgi:HD-GYP domain-containing protein (c-di-GMP phosphodiesterase class II)